jgi:hypothetical protein
VPSAVDLSSQRLGKLIGMHSAYSRISVAVVVASVAGGAWAWHETIRRGELAQTVKRYESLVEFAEKQQLDDATRFWQKSLQAIQNK